MGPILIFFTLLTSFSVFSQTASISDFIKGHKCPKVATTTAISDLPKYLSSNRIFLKTPIEPKYLAQFINEYQKFPDVFRLKMIKAGSVVNLIQGNGISDDPTWDHGTTTFDGRSWANVPGGGGVPWLKKKAPT